MSLRGKNMVPDAGLLGDAAVESFLRGMVVPLARAANAVAKEYVPEAGGSEGHFRLVCLMARELPKGLQGALIEVVAAAPDPDFAGDKGDGEQEKPALSPQRGVPSQAKRSGGQVT